MVYLADGGAARARKHPCSDSGQLLTTLGDSLCSQAYPQPQLVTTPAKPAGLAECCSSSLLPLIVLEAKQRERALDRIRACLLSAAVAVGTAPAGRPLSPTRAAVARDSMAGTAMFERTRPAAGRFGRAGAGLRRGHVLFGARAFVAVCPPPRRRSWSATSCPPGRRRRAYQCPPTSDSGRGAARRLDGWPTRCRSPAWAAGAGRQLDWTGHAVGMGPIPGPHTADECDGRAGIVNSALS
jgi:hypothetical protein